MKLSGTVTALITPFVNEQLDEEGFANNIRFQIAQGIDGILPLGTTGEASTLNADEQQRVISIAVREAKGKVPIWVGTGSYCTKQTIEKTRRAKDLGADVALIVTPYYNRPTQEGIYRHFEAIATQVNIPIMIYNIPGRCGQNIETPTLMRIAELPNVIGVKEASGNIHQAGDFLHLIVKKYPHFRVFSGDDILTLPMIALGAVGVVSVVSNLIPKQVIALTNAAVQGDFALARDLHFQLLSLYKTAFIETNPIPIKTAMNLCGMPAGECRLPLYEMSDENLETLRKQLLRMHLLPTPIEHEPFAEVNI
ncbi:MAG: 4-hydroxy-tetrahydrodipicolinate synthase [Parachlamydiaceae bacterium]